MAKENAVDPELADKVDYIERKLLDVIASQGIKSSNEPKRSKAVEGQMMLFGEDVATIKEKKNDQVNVNFGSIAKEEPAASDSSEAELSNSAKIIADERRAEAPVYRQEVSNVDYNYQESDASIIRNERMSGAYSAPQEDKPADVNVQEIVIDVKQEQDEEQIEESNERNEIVEEGNNDNDSSVYALDEDDEASEELTNQENQVSIDLQEEDMESDNEEVSEESIEKPTSEEVNEETVNLNADEDEEDIESEEYDESEESMIVEEKPVYKPSTVVEEKEEQVSINPASSTSEILRSERESQEPLVVDREKVRESMQTYKPISNESPAEQGDKFATYDAHAIEEVLHASRTESAKNDASRIKRTWKVLETNNSPEFAGIVNVLKQGNVVVVGNGDFILSFANSTICNQAMKPDFKKEASKLFMIYFGNTYDYIALPERIWIEKRNEYVSQYNIGIKYPTLTPINDPSLVVIKPEQQYKDPNEKVLEEAKNKFGKFIRIE